MSNKTHRLFILLHVHTSTEIIRDVFCVVIEFTPRKQKQFILSTNVTTLPFCNMSLPAISPLAICRFGVHYTSLTAQPPHTPPIQIVYFYCCCCSRTWPLRYHHANHHTTNNKRVATTYSSILAHLNRSSLTFCSASNTP